MLRKLECICFSLQLMFYPSGSVMNMVMLSCLLMGTQHSHNRKTTHDCWVGSRKSLHAALYFSGSWDWKTTYIIEILSRIGCVLYSHAYVPALILKCICGWQYTHMHPHIYMHTYVQNIYSTLKSCSLEFCAFCNFSVYLMFSQGCQYTTVCGTHPWGLSGLLYSPREKNWWWHGTLVTVYV